LHAACSDDDRSDYNNHNYNIADGAYYDYDHHHNCSPDYSFNNDDDNSSWNKGL
jgi:hypothetical protein